MSSVTIIHSIAVTALFIIIAFAVLKGLYNVFFHPLSAIPGPWYAAASDLWLTTHVVRLEQCKIVQSLFEKYGPIVRVGPNKVFFNDLTSTKSIYSVHKFDKSVYYKSLLTCVSRSLSIASSRFTCFLSGTTTTTRTPFSSYMRVSTFNYCSMTTLEHTPHSVRRKGYAPHYVPANLAKFQPEMHEPMLELVNVKFYFCQSVGPANVCCRTSPTSAARRRLNALPSSEISWSTFSFLPLMVIVSML